MLSCPCGMALCDCVRLCVGGFNDKVREETIPNEYKILLSVSVRL